MGLLCVCVYGCVCVRVYECVTKIKHWPWACVYVCLGLNTDADGNDWFTDWIHSSLSEHYFGFLLLTDLLAN